MPAPSESHSPTPTGPPSGPPPSVFPELAPPPPPTIEMDPAIEIPMRRGVIGFIGDSLATRREAKLEKARENEEWVNHAFGRPAANTMHVLERRGINRQGRRINQEAIASRPTNRPQTKAEKAEEERIRNQRISHEAHSMGSLNAEQKKARRKVAAAQKKANRTGSVRAQLDEFSNLGREIRDGAPEAFAQTVEAGKLAANGVWRVARSTGRFTQRQASQAYESNIQWRGNRATRRIDRLHHKIRFDQSLGAVAVAQLEEEPVTRIRTVDPKTLSERSAKNRAERAGKQLQAARTKRDDETNKINRLRAARQAFKVNMVAERASAPLSSKTRRARINHAHKLANKAASRP